MIFATILTDLLAYGIMKLYLTILLTLLFFTQFSFGQERSIQNDKRDLPKLNTESLQIETDVELYPNPTKDYLNITLKNSSLKDVKFELYNIIGNKMDIDLDVVNSDSYKINVKEFHSGFYLLIITDPITRFNKAFKFRIQ